jgi:hypothetical protein
MGKKKPIRKGKKNKKPLVVAIVSLIAIIILAFLALFTSQFYGKAIAEGCIGVSYCEFEYTNGQTYTLNVAEGETVLVNHNYRLVNVKVNEVTNNTCKFDLIPANEDDSDIRGITLLMEGTQDGLKLVKTGCLDNCLNLNSNLNSPMFGEFNYDDETSFYANRIHYSKFLFSPKYVLADRKYENTCTDEGVKEYFCANQQLDERTLTCSSGNSCWKGSCMSCTDNYNSTYLYQRDEVDFTIYDGNEPKEYYFKDFCKDENTLVDASCNPGIELTEITCEEGCYLDEHDVARCFSGCVDSDSSSTETKGNVTGLYDYLDSSNTKVKFVEDGCKDLKTVIERTCGTNGKVSYQEIPCTGDKVCQDGKCTQFNALSVNSSNFALDYKNFNTKLRTVNEIEVPFWVITTLKDEDGMILSYKKELFEPNNGYTYNSELTFNNPDKVEKKEVIVYDVPDPSKWSVYLTNTYSHTADESTQK